MTSCSVAGIKVVGILDEQEQPNQQHTGETQEKKQNAEKDRFDHCESVLGPLHA